MRTALSKRTPWNKIKIMVSEYVFQKLQSLSKVWHYVKIYARVTEDSWTSLHSGHKFTIPLQKHNFLFNIINWHHFLGIILVIDVLIFKVQIILNTGRICLVWFEIKLDSLPLRNTMRSHTLFALIIHYEI